MKQEHIRKICSDPKRLTDHIKQKLNARKPQDHLYRRDVSFTPAAVLFPLYFKDGEPYLLFTRRTDQVEHHKKQISLPGGRKDEGDQNLLQTALRETEEEIGLKPADVQILGQTDRFLSNTNYLITPFVGVFHYPYPLKINRAEIDYLIEVPLFYLLDDKNFEMKVVEKSDVPWVLHYYYFGEEIIWGVTGFLLSNFFSIVFELNRNIFKADEKKISSD